MVDFALKEPLLIRFSQELSGLYLYLYFGGYGKPVDPQIGE